MKKLSLIFVLGLLALAYSGCSGCGASFPETPEGAAQKVMQDIDAGNPEIIWTAMPEKYRTDVNALVKDFAGKMDKDVWDKGFAIAAKITTVAKDKKEFILGNQLLAAQLKDNKDEVSKNWDSVVAVLDILATCDLNKLDNLKQFDGQKFLSGTAKDLWKASEKLKEMKMVNDAMPEEMPKKLSEYKVEKVKGDDKTATLKFTDPKGETEETEFVKVGNRWVPKKMADDWDDMIKKAKDGLAEMSGEEMAKQKPQMLAGMAMVESVVDQLQAATSQEEFDKVLMGLAQGGLM